MTVRLSPETAISVPSPAAVPVADCYLCENGLFFTQSSQNAQGSLLITKNNYGKTVIISAANSSGRGCVDGNIALRVADGDEPPLDNIKSHAFSPGKDDYTVLIPFTTHAEFGAISYTPNAFYMPIAQYRDVGLLMIEGKTYITNGYWAVLDG